MVQGLLLDGIQKVSRREMTMTGLVPSAEWMGWVWRGHLLSRQMTYCGTGGM